MTLIQEKEQKFTGLILLTGVDKPGIASGLFQVLSEFAVSVIDVEQLIISDRLILTVLISLNPAHQGAIESDLDACAQQLEVDIATIFTKIEINNQIEEQVDITVVIEKPHPTAIAQITKAISEINVNIASIKRLTINPLRLVLTCTGASVAEIDQAIAAIEFETPTSITVEGV